MAILTPLSLERAQALGASYGLHVTGVRGILAGSVNSNYELTLAGQPPRVFCRIYEEQTAETATAEAQLLAHLSRTGVATPEPLSRNDGGFIAEHEGRPVAMFPWRSGESLRQRDVTPETMRIVGEALAGIHVAGESLTNRPAPSRFGPSALVSRLEGLPADISEDVVETAQRCRGWLDENADGYALPDRGTGLIHGDLFRDNVLWEQGTISALLDFESASLGSFAFDIMVTALAWCFGDTLDLALVAGLGQGYRAGCDGLATPDGEALFRWGELAAVRFTVTRITDFELRPAGTGVYKDFRRFVARWDALRDLGPKGIASALTLA